MAKRRLEPVVEIPAKKRRASLASSSKGLSHEAAAGFESASSPLSSLAYSDDDEDDDDLIAANLLPPASSPAHRDLNAEIEAEPAEDPDAGRLKLKRPSAELLKSKFIKWEIPWVPRLVHALIKQACASKKSQWAIMAEGTGSFLHYNAGSEKWACGYLTLTMLYYNVKSHPNFASDGVTWRNREGAPSIRDWQLVFTDLWVQKGCDVDGARDWPRAGIVDTNAKIGPRDAYLFFTAHGYDCTIVRFLKEQPLRDAAANSAGEAMVDYVAAHFQSRRPRQAHSSSPCITDASPVFLGDREHSTLVIGVEQDHEGNVNFIVLDCSFKDPEHHLLEASASAQALVSKVESEAEFIRQMPITECPLDQFRRRVEGYYSGEQFEVMHVKRGSKLTPAEVSSRIKPNITVIDMQISVQSISLCLSV